MYKDKIHYKVVEAAIADVMQWHKADALEFYSTVKWEQACFMAFWSGPVGSVEDWRNDLSRRGFEIVDILEDSLFYFPPSVFMRFFTLEKFVEEWPYMRIYASRKVFADRNNYDLFWSLAVSGTDKVPPLAAWFQLEEDTKKILVAVVEDEGHNLDYYAHKLDLDLNITRNILSFLCDSVFLRQNKDLYFRDNDFINYQKPLEVKTRWFEHNGKLLKFVTRADY